MPEDLRRRDEQSIFGGVRLGPLLPLPPIRLGAGDVEAGRPKILEIGNRQGDYRDRNDHGEQPARCFIFGLGPKEEIEQQNGNDQDRDQDIGQAEGQ